MMKKALGVALVVSLNLSSLRPAFSNEVFEERGRTLVPATTSNPLQNRAVKTPALPAGAPNTDISAPPLIGQPSIKTDGPRETVIDQPTAQAEAIIEQASPPVAPEPAIRDGGGTTLLERAQQASDEARERAFDGETEKAGQVDGKKEFSNSVTIGETASNASAENEQVDGEPEVGQIIDGWRLEEEIGRGGFSKVFRVSRLADQIVAVFKIATTAAGRKSLEKEVRTHEQLGEKGFLLGANLEGKHPYIILKHYEEPAFRRVIEGWKGKKLPPEKSVPIIKALLSELAYLHHPDRKITHRDVKPDNFLYNEKTGAARLIDFGLSEHEVEQVEASIRTKDGEIQGTPVYAAPEQRKRQTQHLVGTAADIYPVAVIYNEITSKKKGKTKEEKYYSLNIWDVMAQAESEDLGEGGRYADASTMLDAIAKAEQLAQEEARSFLARLFRPLSRFFAYREKLGERRRAAKQKLVEEQERLAEQQRAAEERRIAAKREKTERERIAREKWLADQPQRQKILREGTPGNEPLVDQAIRLLSALPKDNSVPPTTFPRNFMKSHGGALSCRQVIRLAKASCLQDRVDMLQEFVNAHIADLSPEQATELAAVFIEAGDSSRARDFLRLHGAKLSVEQAFELASKIYNSAAKQNFLEEFVTPRLLGK